MKKKNNKKKKYKKKILKFKRFKKVKKNVHKRKKNLKIRRKRIKKNKPLKKKRVNRYQKIKKPQNESLIFKLVKLQLSLKPQFNFKINFSLEKHIQGFFDKISESIDNYKILKQDEKRRLRLEKIEWTEVEKLSESKKDDKSQASIQ